MKRIGLLVLILTLAGCASKAPVPVGETASPTRIEGPKVPASASAPAAAGKLYTVKKGDTLFSIAREHGLNPRDLAAWNNRDSAHRVLVGEQLRLTPPGAVTPTPAAAVATAEGTEVRPIAIGGSVVARPLDGTPAPAPAAAASPAASLASGNTEMLKRAPKGGKLPYSEENLARLKTQDSVAAVPAAAAATAAPLAPAEPAKPAPAPTALPAESGIEWGWPAKGKLLAGFTDGTGGQDVNRGIDIAGKIGDPVLAAAAGKVIFVGVYPKHGNLAVVLHGGGYSSVYAHNSHILVKEGQMVKRGEKIAELGNSDADQPKLHFELRQQGKPLDPLKFLPAQ